MGRTSEVQSGFNVVPFFARAAVALLLVVAGCGQPPVDTGESQEALTACGTSHACGGGYYPASYFFTASSSCCPYGQCSAANPNATDCEPIPGGSSYESCELGCAAGEHVERYDFWGSCCPYYGCSAASPNRSLCAPNSGSSFTMCGSTCPSGYSASSTSFSPTCCPYGACPTPANNAVTCNCVGSACPAPPPPPPPSSDAVYVSQSVPSTLSAGQSYAVSITMRNSGSTTWTSAQAFSLGSSNPRDNTTWGSNRVGLASTDSIAPGASKTFSFTITAPSTPGSYNFQWQMVQDGVAWFGATTPNVAIQVAAATTPMPRSGSWYNPARSGWGLDVSHSSGNAVVTWYTYTTAGAPVWFLAVLAPGAGGYTGTLTSTRWVNGAQQVTNRGTMKLATSSSTAGTLSWVLDGVAGSEPVQYLAFGSGGAVLPVEGMWYTPAQSGWGEAFDVQGSTITAYLTIYDGSGAPLWLTGSAAASSTGATVTLSKVVATNLCPGCSGTPTRTITTAGTLSIGNVSGNTASLTLDLAAPLTSWNRTGLAIDRLTN